MPSAQAVALCAAVGLLFLAALAIHVPRTVTVGAVVEARTSVADGTEFVIRAEHPVPDGKALLHLPHGARPALVVNGSGRTRVVVGSSPPEARSVSISYRVGSERLVRAAARYLIGS